MVNLTAKKVYCSKCEKLVRVKAQKAGAKDQYCCIKCNNIIWQKEGFNWKHTKDI